jgi:hypothetical protein
VCSGQLSTVEASSGKADSAQLFIAALHRDHECVCVYGGPPLLSSGQSSWLHNGAVLCFL